MHRDLKPANLFVTTRGQMKILDFGLAKMSAHRMDDSEALAALPTGVDPRSLTSPGTTMGTVAYMSPEQARGEDADGRSDLFSFGLVLYEMATGVQAFRGATYAVLFDAILNRQPTRLLQVNTTLPRGLETVIERSLQKRPESRYQRASDLLADLRAYAPGGACSPTPRRCTPGPGGARPGARRAAGTACGRAGRICVAVQLCEHRGGARGDRRGVRLARACV